VIQRSFGAFDLPQATPRLSQPFGYPNAVGIFSVVVAVLSLWLVTRPQLAARVVGGATLALTLYVLPMTGSRGSLIALGLGVVLYAWLQPRRVECVAGVLAVLLVAVPAAAWTLSLTPLNKQVAGLQPSAGVGLLLAGIAVVVAGAALVVLALGLVDRLPAGAYARAERLTWQGAIGLAVVAAIGFMAVHGGPVGAVRSLWDGLAGGGGVTNEPGRFASLSSNMRSRWWEEAIDSFQARPWRGWGASTFSIVDQLRRPDTTVAGETHNAALQVLSGLGLAGGITALGALVCSAWAAIAGFRALSGEARAAGAAVLAALAAFALHNQLDWDWTFLALTLAVYPLVGVLATAGTRTDEPVSTSGPRRLQAAIALPVLGLAAIVALLPYLSARAEQRAGTLDSRAADQDEAGNALGAATLRESALVELDLARGFEPVNYHALLDQANVQLELGRTQDALNTIRQAIRLEPYTLDAWLARAQIEQGLGQKTKACATLVYAYSISGYQVGIQHAAAEAGCPIAGPG
jgi:O-Antigen ligase